MPRRLLITGCALPIGLCAIWVILSSCSDKKSTVPQEPTISEIHAPWDNAEAEAMAVAMGGELAAPLELYEQVISDLEAIRTQWGERLPTVVVNSHMPKWHLGQVEVAVDAETYATIRSGFPARWDSLNQSLRIDRAVFHDSTLSLTIAFDARLSPQALARLYAGLPGVRWTKMVAAQTTGLSSVDGLVDGDSRLYLFSRQAPFCEKLCETADLWLFRVTGSEIDSLGAWTAGNPTATVDSVSWWADGSRVRGLALAPGSYDNFPDSDHVAPAAISFLGGISPTSRSLLVRWNAPGDDDNSGIASGYEVSIFGPGVPRVVWPGEILPSRAGQPESLLVEVPLADLNYRVSVRAHDEQGNWSPWSADAIISSISSWSSFTAENSDLSNNSINAVAADQYGRLWCAVADGGINRFDGENWALFFTIADRSVVGSRTLTFDSERGIIWCAAENGALCGIRTNSTSHLGFSSNAIGLSGAAIAAIEAADGDVWCSNALSGAAKWDGSSWTTFNTTNSGLVNNVVWDISAAPNGDIWFGTSGGASRFDGTAWTNYATTNSGIGANLIRAIAVGADGTVWCGHHDKFVGVSTFDGTTWRTIGTADSLLSTYINAIAFNSDGRAWLGTSLGLARQDIPWESFLTSNSPIISGTINSLAFTNDQILWIGTPKGLSRYELPLVGR